MIVFDDVNCDLCLLQIAIGCSEKTISKFSVLTSLITSPSGLPADCRIASGINGSVYAEVDAMLPLSDDVALVFGDVAEFFTN